MICLSMSCTSRAQSVLADKDLNKPELVDQYNLLKICAANDDIECQYKMFKLVINNDPYLNDYADEAFKYIINAGANGHIEAQFTIGSLYQTGIIVQKSADAALTWLLEAAKNGHVKAQYMVGSNYEARGRTSQSKSTRNENWDKAIQWYSKANFSGFLHAKRQLGVILISRDVNSAEGHDLIREAALLGDGRSMNLVALKLKYEWKESHNQAHFNKALIWYQKSLSAGYEPSQKDLENLYSEEEPTKLDDIN